MQHKSVYFLILQVYLMLYFASIVQCAECTDCLKHKRSTERREVEEDGGLRQTRGSRFSKAFSSSFLWLLSISCSFRDEIARPPR